MTQAFKIVGQRRIKCLATQLCLVFALCSSASIASEYSDGLQAYLDGNYESARSFWLKGAQQKDAKSMFNLGLLHERKQIDDADQEQAQRWFRSAGRNGYAAADYYLALYLLANNSVNSVSMPEVRKLLERSSRNGYSPAKQKLKSLGEGKTDQANHSFADTQNRPTQISAAGYRTESWLNRRPIKSWTIQMLVFNDEQKVQRFIDQHGLKNQAAYYAENVGDKTMYKLVYGVYDSKDKADFARQNMSIELKQHGPWLRTITSVQSAIKTQR